MRMNEMKRRGVEWLFCESFGWTDGWVCWGWTNHRLVLFFFLLSLCVVSNECRRLSWRSGVNNNENQKKNIISIHLLCMHVHVRSSSRCMFPCLLFSSLYLFHEHVHVYWMTNEWIYQLKKWRMWRRRMSLLYSFTSTTPCYMNITYIMDVYIWVEITGQSFNSSNDKRERHWKHALWKEFHPLTVFMSIYTIRNWFSQHSAFHSWKHLHCFEQLNHPSYVYIRHMKMGIWLHYYNMAIEWKETREDKCRAAENQLSLGIEEGIRGILVAIHLHAIHVFLFRCANIHLDESRRWCSSSRQCDDDNCQYQYQSSSCQ